MIRVLLVLALLLMISCSPSEQGLVEEQKESYIVILNSSELKSQALKSGDTYMSQSVVRQMMNDVGSHFDLKVQKLFYATVQGGVYKMTTSEAESLALDPRVAYVEKDQVVSINAVQANATWGLDRIDQRDLPLDGQYSYNSNESAVNVYVVDTGVRISHSDFQGRAQHGYDAVDSDSDATDCNGHGTHVAGTIAGNSYGVAKSAIIYGVRVLNCRGSGSFSGVIEGIEWVTVNHQKPAVANMSLGGGASRAIDQAVQASIQAGVTYVVAAGNDNSNACNASPARVPQAITVGSTDASDERSGFSNYGECVDIFAPGSNISSTWIDSNTSIKTISGTSMASPHVAGVVARYLATHPEATPEQVTQALVEGALAGKVKRAGNQSPNLLLNTEYLQNDKGTEEPPKLEKGVVLKNLSAPQFEQQRFEIEVPEGATDLVVYITGGTGDADLYIQLNSPPTDNNYECRPFKSGNEESCSFKNPKAGVYHIMLKAYASYTDVSLSVDYKLNSGSLSGALNKAGDSNEHHYSALNGTQNISLIGPMDADFDLYLYKQTASGDWEFLKSSLGYSSNESIEYEGVAGKYMAVVRSFSGQGNYNLKIEAK